MHFILLKKLGWNTPLYNLTKNMNTFPFLLKMLGWNTLLYNLTKNTNTFAFFLLKKLGWNTPLYNLTKNMNTFVFCNELTINHEVMADSQCDVPRDYLQ